MTRKLRILFISHTASLGGAELALERLVLNLDTAKVEPVILIFEDGPLADRFRNAGIDVHIITLPERVVRASRFDIDFGIWRHSRYAPGIFRHIVRIARLASKLNVQMVHTNTLKSDVLGGFGAILARKLLVWSVHDRIASDYMPKFAVHSLRTLVRWLPHCVVTNSHSTLHTFLPKLPKFYEIIYPGVVVPQRKSTARSIEPDGGESRASDAPPVIGIVGRISPTKGIDVFLRATVLVSQQHPATRFKIIGSALFNDLPYEDSIRKQASDLHLSNVEFTGFRSNVYEEIEQLSVLVHAATTPEPFGQVIVEAMMCSKPVVATDAGGVQEIVRDGLTGWLVEPGNAEDMAERIIWLIEHPEDAMSMGVEGRERAVEHFSLQEAITRFENVYRDVWQRSLV